MQIVLDIMRQQDNHQSKRSTRHKHKVDVNTVQESSATSHTA